ncbi:MAG: hypothetical protein KDK70_07920 [Myxococcales bacterium]|nr:hypothetical protein [Myxococcales bacterium]
MDLPSPGVSRRWLVVGLACLMACGQLESEQAQEVADATRETVERGVDKAKETIDRVDMDKVRRAWNSTVDAVRDLGQRSGDREPGPDPLTGMAEAIECSEAGDRCTVTADFFDRARHHPGRVAEQARVSPVSGPVSGIRLDALDPGSIGERLGLRSGDVVTHVNDASLGSMQDAMMLYMQLQDARRFTVRYRRGDQDRTLVIDVA